MGDEIGNSGLNDRFRDLLGKDWGIKFNENLGKEARRVAGGSVRYAIQEVGGWRKLNAILKFCEKEGAKAQKKATQEGALFLLKAIKEGLDKSAPGGVALKPLSPFTLAVRKLLGIRGRRPLLARRNLRRSLAVKKTPSGDYFVGVPIGAKTPQGKSIAEIAATHEFGAAPRVVQLSDKQKAFLGVVAGLIPSSKTPPKPGAGGGGALIIRTPARPFIGPVFEKHKRAIQERIMKALADAMNGAYGKY